MLFAELLGRFAYVVPDVPPGGGAAACRHLLGQASVAEERFRMGKTKVFLAVGVLDALESMRMQYLAKRAVKMQAFARRYLARVKVRELKAAREAKRKAAEEAKNKALMALRAKEEAESVFPFFRFSVFPRFRDSEIPRFRDFEISRFRDFEKSGFEKKVATSPGAPGPPY